MGEDPQRRTLLAVIGPSGAGKTSFLRAGVVASRPDGLGRGRARPRGSRRSSGWGRPWRRTSPATPRRCGQLVGSTIPRSAYGVVSLRWRAAHGEALLVVDQFEELFTLNPPEVQARFAALLGRLASEADVHVLLSLRDDFLMRCSEPRGRSRPSSRAHAARPRWPATALRRALVEPAKTAGLPLRGRGARRRDAGAVEGERGALPLLAFAVSRLWEKRDRERKLLTREAHEEIGGVAGRPRPARGGDARPDRPRAPGPSCARSSATWSPRRARARWSTGRSCCRSSPTGGGRRGGAAPAGRRPAADLLRGRGRGGRAEPPPGRDRPRVAAQGLAAARALAGAGRRGARSCATSCARRRTCGRRRGGRRTCCGPGPRTASTRRGGSATRAGSPRSRRSSRGR